MYVFYTGIHGIRYGYGPTYVFMSERKNNMKKIKIIIIIKLLTRRALHHKRYKNVRQAQETYGRVEYV